MIRACCSTSSRALACSTWYETLFASAKPTIKIASSAALNFQTRFTRTPVVCSKLFRYLRGVSHGQCHVLSGCFVFSFSVSFGGGGGGAGSALGFGNHAVHFRNTLVL